MKNIHLITLVLLISLLSNFQFKTQQYYEDSITKNNKLRFFNSYINEISNNKLTFKYSEDKGIYGEFNENIKWYDTTLSVPEKFLIHNCNIMIS